MTKAIVSSPVNEEKKEMEEEEVFRSNAAKLYSWGQSNCFFPVNEEVEEEEEITTTMLSAVAMQQSCTRQPRQFLFQ